MCFILRKLEKLIRNISNNHRLPLHVDLDCGGSGARDAMWINSLSVLLGCGSSPSFYQQVHAVRRIRGLGTLRPEAPSRRMYYIWSLKISRKCKLPLYGSLSVLHFVDYCMLSNYFLKAQFNRSNLCRHKSTSFCEWCVDFIYGSRA